MNEYEAKVEAKKQRYLDRAAVATQQENNLYNQAREMSAVIPFGQPIVCNSNRQKDINYRAKINRTFDKAYDASEKASYYADKAESVGKGGISSDDPDAVRKLTEKLQMLEALQIKMKAANKAIKKNDIPALKKLGYTDKEIKELFVTDFRVPGFPCFTLTNNNANIRRIKQRIETLKKNATAKPIIITKDNYTYKEADNRCQFVFDGKPEYSIRSLLKRYSFKWSPSRTAWVRQLTGNGRFAAKMVIREIDAIA